MRVHACTNVLILKARLILYSLVLVRAKLLVLVSALVVKEDSFGFSLSKVKCHTKVLLVLVLIYQTTLVSTFSILHLYLRNAHMG